MVGEFDPTSIPTIFTPAIISIMMGMLAIFFVIGIAFYIYSALALMAIAKRTKAENPWLAWIPIGNLVLMANIAQMPWWPVLLILGIFIPIIGFLVMIAFFVFVMIWTWKICEARNKPGWWALLSLIPFAGPIWISVMYGILAWGKE